MPALCEQSVRRIAGVVVLPRELSTVRKSGDLFATGMIRGRVRVGSRAGSSSRTDHRRPRRAQPAPQPSSASAMTAASGRTRYSPVSVCCSRTTRSVSASVARVGPGIVVDSSADRCRAYHAGRRVVVRPSKPANTVVVSGFVISSHTPQVLRSHLHHIVADKVGNADERFRNGRAAFSRALHSQGQHHRSPIDKPLYAIRTPGQFVI